MFRFAVQGLLLNLLLCQSAFSQSLPTANEADLAERKLAPLFDAIGLDFSNQARWVDVECGPLGGNLKVHGWLLKDEADSLLVFDSTGRTSVFRRPRPNELRPKPRTPGSLSLDEFAGQSAHVAWAVTSGDYEAECRSFLKAAAPYLDKSGLNGQFSFKAAKPCLLGGAIRGYGASRLGKRELSRDLLALAFKAYTILNDSPWADEKAEFHQRIISGVVAGMRGAAISDANRGAPRPHLLQIWEIIAKLPGDFSREEAMVLVNGYKSLIEEDRVWHEPDPKAITSMSVNEKAAYWMHQLRDLDDSMYSDMAFASLGQRTPRWILSDFLIPQPGDNKPNPAKELKRLGIAALPTIIAHLDDTRPTRTGPLLRYGDCCQQIFEAISNHTIFAKRSTEAYPVELKEEKLCKERAEAWWAEYRLKGEKTLLMLSVAKGEHDSVNQARNLIQKYPNDALEPITKGATLSRDPRIRTALVESASQLQGEAATAFLRQELSGPWLRPRITAARALAKRGDKAGCVALKTEWKQKEWAENWLDDDTWAADDLIAAMLGSGDLATTEVLAKSFERQPLWIRSRVIRVVGSWQGDNRDLRGQPLTPAIGTIIEDLLAHALEDMEEESSSLGGGPNNRGVNNLAIADLAAEALVMFWRQPMAALLFGHPLMFDIYGRPGIRERQRLQVKNVWLKKRGMPLLVVRTPSRIKSADAALTGPILAAARTEKSPEGRRLALANLDRLGLPALPALRTALESLPADHPARGDFEAVAKRLALTVAEVRLSVDSIVPGDDLQKRLAAMEGKPIDSTDFTKLFQSISKNLPRGVRGIHLKLERPGDDSGAHLTVSLVADKPLRQGLAPQIDVRKSITLDDEQVEGAGIQVVAGLGGEEVTLVGIDWEAFAQKLQRVFPPRPEQYLFVHMGCEQRR